MTKSLLIIDDDALVAKVYSAKFTQEGFNVLVAPDGTLALKLFKESQPAIVILDLQLPDVSGVEVLGQIRQIGQSEHVPIIVFSSTYLSADIQAAWKAGATKCLSKANCTPAQLVGLVKSLLRTSKPASAIPSTTPPPAPNRATPVGQDSELTDDLRQDLVASLPALLASLRVSLQRLTRSTDEKEREGNLETMYHRMHALTNNASLLGMTRIAQLSEAIESLLREMFEKPRHINSSTLRTVSHAVDFLGASFSQGFQSLEQNGEPLNILVVDDEPLSRRAILYALEKAKLGATELNSPHSAYQTLESGNFDLIFLDVDMPGMSGFELCTKLRTLPKYKKTPVVFVTSLNDFESRAQSTIAGANDLIAKPFLFVELAVKAMVYLLRNRLDTARHATV